MHRLLFIPSEAFAQQSEKLPVVETEAFPPMLSQLMDKDTGNKVMFT
jgi:hypothetical protein